jgi:hypothetical protein
MELSSITGTFQRGEEMNSDQLHERSRVLFALTALLPLLLGDAALREARAEAPPPYFDCQGEQIDPADYQALLDHWAWLQSDVYVPVFGPDSPYPACEAGIILAAHPSRSVVVGEPPDPGSPSQGAEAYYLTDQVVIAGHRVTEAGGLPVLLNVVHYVPVEELASPPEVQSIGLVVGILQAGDGGGQSVPVMALVTTLALAAPDPAAELGCCLPDGSFATLAAVDCATQGGSLAAFGPLGDGDGDGADDACAYGYGTLTFLTVAQTLTADELEAFEEFERVLADLTGQSVGGEFEPAPGAGGGQGGGGEPGMSCSEFYRWCVRQAKIEFQSDMDLHKGILAICLSSAAALFQLTITICGFLGPVAGPWCAVGALTAFVIAKATCVAVYKYSTASARNTYRNSLANCTAAAQAMGCSITYTR